MIAFDIGEAISTFSQLKDLMEVGITFIVFGFSTGKSTEKGTFKTKRFAGAFGDEGDVQGASRRIATGLEELLGQGAEPPPFGGTTAAQNQFLEFLTGEANRRTAVRGLGPASAGDIAQNIAPALIGFRQQGIENQAARRGQDIQGLLELLGLAQPQILGGTETTGKETKLGIGV